MPITAVGLFDNRGVADQVVHDLDASGFPRKQIRILTEPMDMAVAEVTSIPHTDFEVGLDRELKAMGASELEAAAYVQQVRRGAALVFAPGSHEEVDGAAGIMNRHGAIKVEELIGREPAASRTVGAGLPLRHDANLPPAHEMSTQTGRLRQSGDGVRMFVW